MGRSESQSLTNLLAQIEMSHRVRESIEWVKVSSEHKTEMVNERK